MPWLRQLVADLSPQRLRFNPRLVHLGFGVDKVTLELVFLQALWFSTFTIIQPFRHSFIYSFSHYFICHLYYTVFAVDNVCI